MAKKAHATAEPNQRPVAPHAARARPPNANRSSFAWAFIMLIVTLLVWQRYDTGGLYLGMHERMLFLTGVALLTGTVFWIVTPGSGQVSIRQLGIRLGGGAAIGAAFMLLANQLTPQSLPGVGVVVELNEQRLAEQEANASVRMDKSTVKGYLLKGTSQVAVVFKESTSPTGKLVIRYWDNEGNLAPK